MEGNNELGLAKFLEGKNAMARSARRGLNSPKDPPKKSRPVKAPSPDKPKPLIGGAEALFD